MMKNLFVPTKKEAFPKKMPSAKKPSSKGLPLLGLGGIKFGQKHERT